MLPSKEDKIVKPFFAFGFLPFSILKQKVRKGK